MPTPIWEGKKTNELVRFNHAGYICPMHNYEPETLGAAGFRLFRLTMFNAWILVPVWLYDQNKHERRARDFTSQQIPSCCLVGPSNHTNLCDFSQLHRLLSRQQAAAGWSVEGCYLIITLMCSSSATPPALHPRAKASLTAHRWRPGRPNALTGVWSAACAPPDIPAADVRSLSFHKDIIQMEG